MGKHHPVLAVDLEVKTPFISLPAPKKQPTAQEGTPKPDTMSQAKATPPLAKQPPLRSLDADIRKLLQRLQINWVVAVDEIALGPGQQPEKFPPGNQRATKKQIGGGCLR